MEQKTFTEKEKKASRRKAYIIIDGLNRRGDYHRFIHDPQYNLTLNCYRNFPGLVESTYDYFSKHPYKKISLQFQTDERVPSDERLTDAQRKILESLVHHHNESVDFIGELLGKVTETYGKKTE